MYAKLIHDISLGARPPVDLNENAIDAMATVLGAAAGLATAGVLLNPGSIASAATAGKKGGKIFIGTISRVSSTTDSFIRIQS